MASSTNQNRSTFNGLTKGGSLSKYGLRAPTTLLEDMTMIGRGGPAFAPIELATGQARTAPAWKRGLDVTLVLLTIPIWLPLMILISGWIKAFSSGPVFFRQERIGLGTKVFTILKFRTMKAGSETTVHENHFKSLVENGAPMTKLDALKDSRLIFGGRVLRITGVDELPQLFNVLFGDMSLVGPRPCLPKELNWYSSGQLARFNVLPGITGYWQVNGKNKTTFNQMVEMDIQYAERISLLFDLVIILGTVPALAMQAIEARWQLTGQQSKGAVSSAAKTL